MINSPKVTLSADFFADFGYKIATVIHGAVCIPPPPVSK